MKYDICYWTSCGHFYIKMFYDVFFFQAISDTYSVKWNRMIKKGHIFFKRQKVEIKFNHALICMVLFQGIYLN